MERTLVSAIARPLPDGEGWTYRLEFTGDQESGELDAAWRHEVAEELANLVAAHGGAVPDGSICEDRSEWSWFAAESDDDGTAE